MIAEELINQMIPPLKPTDTVKKAMQWMEELRVNQLPVIENETYKGLISEDIIYQYNDENLQIGEVDLICANVFVRHNQHFFDIIRLTSAYTIQVVTVLGEQNSFLGVVTVNDTLNALAQSSSMQEVGGILVLLIEKRDYSLTDISRLVESNDAKILGTYVMDDKQDIGKIKVTLKINHTDLNRIVATFERFSYKVIGKFQTANHQDIDQERIDHLFKYLSI